METRIVNKYTTCPGQRVRIINREDTDNYVTYSKEVFNMYTIRLTMDEAIRLSARLERAAEEDRQLSEELEIPECREYFLDNADFFKSLAQRLDRAIGIGGV